MSRVRIALVLFGLFGLGTSMACGGMGDISLPTAEITAPWKDMNLPVDDGNVLYSNDSTLTVNYKGDKVEKLGPKYIKAIAKSGYKKQTDNSANGIVAATFKGKGANISLAITHSTGNTVVAVTKQ